MTLWDIINQTSNLTRYVSTEECGKMCSKTLYGMFLPLTWMALLTFALAVVLAITYVLIPREIRKNTIENSPYLFLRYIKWFIFMLLVPTGWLAGGVLMYVLFQG